MGGKSKKVGHRGGEFLPGEKKKKWKGERRGVATKAVKGRGKRKQRNVKPD